MRKYRYLVDFDMGSMECEYRDVVIIGSGIAGVYTALEIPPEYKVAIFTKESLESSNSVLAQGGIAVSLGKEDSPKLHFKDTLYAGAGLCDEDSVWVLVNEAAQNIDNLCNMGVKFDKMDESRLALTREAAHSKRRIIHAGDTTGKVVLDQLISVVRTKDNVGIFERTYVLDLLVEEGSVKGVLVYDELTREYKTYLSNIVVCATGGFGQLYSNTTNPEVATGDGVSMAYRAGAQLMDLEFIQFHPTVLNHPDDRSFLISEAVRGEGGILKNINCEKFMLNYHELGELAPRDVVSRSIFKEMKKTGSHHVFLDITFKGREFLETRFPNIFKTLIQYGIDMSKDYIPVAPAEHYCMGGIKTDVFGRTGITGLYACGEATCNGIHGANRLASNSLLEGLVFGHKIGVETGHILGDESKRSVEFSIKYKTDRLRKELDSKEIKQELQDIMNGYAGIVRDGGELMLAKKRILEYREILADMRNETIDDFEIQNMVLLASLVIDSALEREESRGAHYRSDFKELDNENWKRHVILSKYDNSPESI